MPFDIKLTREQMVKYGAELRTEVTICWNQDTPEHVRQEIALLGSVLQQDAQKQVMLSASLYVPGARNVGEVVVMENEKGVRLEIPIQW